MSKLASILIISRNRFDSLLEAINSIINTTNDLKKVEILLRFDDDDDDSLSRVSELPKDKIDINMTVGKRYGYENLHKYVNEICKQAQGEFLVWFNDDCVIKSKNWDIILSEYIGQIVCLFPNHEGTGSGNIFPIISKKIYDILGHFSLSQQVDTWQQIVGSRAKIEKKRDDLIFIHNREQDYVSDPDRKAVLKRTAKVWAESDKILTEDANKVKKYIRKMREEMKERSKEESKEEPK